MKGVVVIDTNLLVLLIVGLTSPAYISKHKRLVDEYTVYDFELLGLIVSEFSEIVTLPHILSETSSFLRQMGDPALGRIQTTFKTFIDRTVEVPATSMQGAEREEFRGLGLTDAVIMHFCGLTIDGIAPTLLTADEHLANAASSLGYNFIDYRREYQTA